MKSLEIGSLKVKLAETLEDINIKRFTAVKQWVVAKDCGMDLPLNRNVFVSVIRAFNESNSAEMLIKLNDHVAGLRNVAENTDANQMIFALATLEDGEDSASTDETLLKEKLERFANAGLTQWQCKQYAEDFIAACNFN